jgi:hypothetical protein
VNESAVMTPEADIAAARTKPLTLAVFATRFPLTVVVRVASLPRTTLEDDGPRRKTPLMLPVPASTIKSPPTDEPWPLAWPSK